MTPAELAFFIALLEHAEKEVQDEVVGSDRDDGWRKRVSLPDSRDGHARR